MASFQDRAQHTIAQLDKEVRSHCVFRWRLSIPRLELPQIANLAAMSID
jgi:hypothetical protein